MTDLQWVHKLPRAPSQTSIGWLHIKFGLLIQLVLSHFSRENKICLIFTLYLLSTYYILKTVLGSGDVKVNEIDKEINLHPYGDYIHKCGEMGHNKIN